MSPSAVQTRPSQNGEMADAAPGTTARRLDTLGVQQQLGLLRRSLADSTDEQEKRESQTTPQSSTIARRSVKTLVSLALIAVIGWVPLQRLLLTTSAEATVNARVITLRSPIEGRIAEGDVSIGAGIAFRAGEIVVRVENPRADRARLDELQRSISLLTDQRRSSVERLAALESQQAEQLAQFEKFRLHRTEHIEARRLEILADKDAVIARLDAASSAFVRSTKLSSQGIAALATHEQAQRDFKVLTSALVAAQRRLEAVEIELAAGRQGIFVTDGFNDVPRSAQRASELGQQIADVTVAIAQQDRQLSSLQPQLAAEKDRYHLMSVAEMRSPTNGRIWEVLVSPGEYIRVGQDMMRILDCNGAVVTAAVSESNFNRLQIGGNATFRLRGESRELPGHITGLHGLASTPANLAIHQGMLAREPYHATVEVPALAAGEGCQIGRTGIVSFETASSSWLP